MALNGTVVQPANVAVVLLSWIFHVRALLAPVREKFKVTVDEPLTLGVVVGFAAAKVTLAGDTVYELMPVASGRITTVVGRRATRSAAASSRIPVESAASIMAAPTWWRW